MTKNKVHVKIGGASYTIVTEDEAEYVETLADEISENMRAIINSNPSLSMTQAAVLVALDNADASKKATASADNLRAQIKDYLESIDEHVYPTQDSKGNFIQSLDSWLENYLEADKDTYIQIVGQFCIRG